LAGVNLGVRLAAGELHDSAGGSRPAFISSRSFWALSMTRRLSRWPWPWRGSETGKLRLTGRNGESTARVAFWGRLQASFREGPGQERQRLRRNQGSQRCSLYHHNYNFLKMLRQEQ